MRIRIALVTLVAATAALAVAALQVATPSGASPTGEAGRCGADRWLVRTLQDRPKLLPAQKTTIRKLVRIPRPNSLPAIRIPVEHRVVTVVAHVGTAVATIEANGDLRFPIQNLGGAAHLAAVMPHPFCNSRATQSRRRQMGTARMTFLKRPCGIPATITGVIFFTTKRQPPEFRSAPSGIELRPVLGFTCPYE
jgi:hypothetical protein